MLRAAILLTACFAFSVSKAQAQEQVKGIQAEASANIDRPAERMVMRIDLLAKSTKSLPDAFAKLKARRSKVEKTLVSLGAVKDSIGFETAKADRSQDAMYEQMLKMAKSRMGSRTTFFPGGAAIAAPGAAAPSFAPVAAPAAIAPPAATAPAATAPAIAPSPFAPSTDNPNAVPLPPGVSPSAARGRKPAQPQLPPRPFYAIMAMTAEWPVNPGDPEAQVLEMEKLQATINAADLAGLKESQEMSPEEAELSEEMESSAIHLSYGSGRNEPKRGEPEFSFTASVPTEDYEKALAAAFRDAKIKATQLAKAAEIELGPLQSLQSSVRVTREEENNGFGLPHSRFSSYPVEFTPTDFVIPGSQPGMLSCSVTVSISYAIK